MESISRTFSCSNDAAASERGEVAPRPRAGLANILPRDRPAGPAESSWLALQNRMKDATSNAWPCDGRMAIVASTWTAMRGTTLVKNPLAAVCDMASNSIRRGKEESATLPRVKPSSQEVKRAIRCSSFWRVEQSSTKRSIRHEGGGGGGGVHGGQVGGEQRE